MKKLLLLIAILIITGTGIAYAYAPQYGLSSGLVGYWSLDRRTINWTLGATDDVSGNGNGGDFINMSKSSNPAKAKNGQGINFQVGDQSIQLTGKGAGSLNLTGTALSMSVWVKSPLTVFNADSTHLTIFYKGGNTSGYRFLLETNGTMITQMSGSGVNFTTSGSSSKCTANQWCHIVYVYDGATARVYFNNVVNSTTQSASGNIVDSSATTPIIGASSIGSGSSTYHLSGIEDELRIYNRALSAQEVRALYRQGLAGNAHLTR